MDPTVRQVVMMSAAQVGKVVRTRELVEFYQGNITNEEAIQENTSRKGTKVTFIPDEELFGKYRLLNEYIEKMLWNYCYLNPGLTILFNGEKFYSEKGLYDLMEENKDEPNKNVTEELVLYMFLGVFVIFIVDSFARVSKYKR